MALDEATVRDLMPLLQALVDATVASSQRASATVREVPGTVTSASGADCDVEPDDAPGESVPATRMHPAIIEGSRVKLRFSGAGTADAYGPIPQ